MDQGTTKRLGRGLSALLQAPVAIEPARAPEPIAISDEDQSGSQFVYIPVRQITPSPFQPRRVFDEAMLRGLADSIRQAGVMQPIVVRRLAASSFELVAGERRWRAATIAGLETIPAIVQVLDDEHAAQWALIENIQREDLNAMDRARALQQMVERFGLSQQQVAERVGLERASVANLVRLNELEPEIAELIAVGGLNAGHGKALLSMAGGGARIELAREAARDQWSVRRLESAARRFAAPGRAKVAPMTESVAARRAVVADLERQLSQHLGTKVQIATDRDGTKGRIQIEFYGIDHFDGLLSKIGLK